MEMRKRIFECIDLARAKSEAPVNIKYTYNLLKQQQKRVMLNGDGNKNGEK